MEAIINGLPNVDEELISTSDIPLPSDDICYFDHEMEFFPSDEQTIPTDVNVQSDPANAIFEPDNPSDIFDTIDPSDYIFDSPAPKEITRSQLPSSKVYQNVMSQVVKTHYIDNFNQTSINKMLDLSLQIVRDVQSLVNKEASNFHEYRNLLN